MKLGKVLLVAPAMADAGVAQGVVNAREFRTNVSVSAFVPRLPKGSMVTDYTGLSAKAELARGAERRELLRDEWYGDRRRQ